MMILSCWTMHVQAQQGVSVSGSIQSDVLIPEKDNEIGARDYKEWALTNTYVEANLMSKYVDAGARIEYLEHPLPGYENKFKGWGLANAFVKGRYKKVELTVGNFYDQFGSGFIFRTYEDRSLGIDNSILGGRVVVKPTKELTLKALTGKQRQYWSLANSWLTGADVDYHIGIVNLGASFVNKHEEADNIMTDATHRLNIPENVNAFDVRASLQKGKVNVAVEYAQKTQDPSFDNNYIYRRGYVAMLSASYSKKGMGVLLQVRRNDNMSFRSERSMTGSSSFISYLPPLTLDHTYTLPALYPYYTQPGGEWAYQAEGSYIFKQNTLLGGKYGTTIRLNFSHVHSIDQNQKLLNGQQKGSDGYGSAFWKWGDWTYYQDFNVQINKKLSQSFKLNLMYMNQFYNQTVLEGEGGMVHCDIFVGEGQYRISKNLSLRGEAQYLFTGEDQGDWAFGLLELSVAPHWMFTVSDQYNVGQTHTHYYIGSVTFSSNGHRLQLSYGRTQEGYSCSGGVCRYVPAYKGLTVSYNYNF